MTWYIETSAAAKLIILEAETAALRRDLKDNNVAAVSSDLLETELRRVALRQGVPQSDVEDVLDAIDIAEIPRSVYRRAGLLPPPGLRSLDALHLAAALHQNAVGIYAYDGRIIEAAKIFGFEVRSPA